MLWNNNQDHFQSVILSMSQMKFMQSKYTCSIKNKYKLLKKANKHIP